MNPKIIKALVLKDGWSQTPPKDDGEYWFRCAKPWHTETFDDYLTLIKVENGRRVGEIEEGDLDFGSMNGGPVWDWESQHEMIAAWRRKRAGETFKNLEVEPEVAAVERHPLKCLECGGLGAVYRVVVKCGETEGNPFVCFSCDHDRLMPKDYFGARFLESFRKAFEQDPLPASVFVNPREVV